MKYETIPGATAPVALTSWNIQQKGKDETFSFHEDVPKIPSFQRVFKVLLQSAETDQRIKSQ